MPYTGTIHRKPRFTLIKTEFSYYWTAILPTQTHRSTDKKEVLRNLATVLEHIQKGNIDLEEIDLGSGKPVKPMVGGMLHLLSFLPNAEKVIKRYKKTVKAEIRKLNSSPKTSKSKKYKSHEGKRKGAKVQQKTGRAHKAGQARKSRRH